jgi:hypothetical protein
MSSGGSIEVGDVPSWMTVAQCTQVKNTGTLIVVSTSHAKNVQSWSEASLFRTDRMLVDALRAERAILVDEASLRGVRDGKFATDVSGFLLDTRAPVHTIILAGTP